MDEETQVCLVHLYSNPLLPGHANLSKDTFCSLERRKTSDQGCCCIRPVIKTWRNWQFSKTSWPAGKGFGDFAHLTMICFGILFILITGTNLCYWICCLQCKGIIAEFWHKSEASFQMGVISATFKQKKLHFQLHLSLRLSRFFLTPLVRPSLFHRFAILVVGKNNSVEINFMIWKLILGCSQYFSMKFIISQVVLEVLTENILGLSCEDLICSLFKKLPLKVKANYGLVFDPL